MRKLFDVLRKSIKVLSCAIITCLASPLFAGVNPDGSFSYSVPIVLPPGTNGMQPSLSLEYNSNNGNGVMGMGWEITGIPSITRDPSYQINYDGTDEYIGPHGHLVKVGDYYHYEHETFSRFQMIGENVIDATGQVIGVEPEQWIETKPDGTKYYYGASSDSRVGAPSDKYYFLGTSGRYHTWGLSKVEDIHGNYYIVEYVKEDFFVYNPKTNGKISNSLMLPQRIIYSFGAGITKYRVIKFEYDTQSRVDYRVNFSKRAPIYLHWLLKSISITTGVTQILGVPLFSDSIRKYAFDYEQSKAGLSRLKKMTEYGDTDNILQTSSFDWQDDSTQLFNEDLDITTAVNLNSSLWSAKNSQIIPGDYDGDGFLDLILQPKEISVSPIMVLFNNTGPKSTIVLPNNWCTWDSDEWIVNTGDFNGDGRTDVLLQRKKRIVNNYEVSACLAISKGGTFTYKNLSGIFERFGAIMKTEIPDGPPPASQPSGLPSPKNPDLWYDTYHKVHVGDFNGDGISDVILQAKTIKDSTILVLFDKTAKTYSTNITNAYGMNAEFWSQKSKIDSATVKNRFTIGDFNGDGKSDIHILGHDKKMKISIAPIFLLSANNTSMNKIFKDIPIPTIRDWDVEHYDEVVGDFNGDGVIDIGQIDYEPNATERYSRDFSYSTLYGYAFYKEMTLSSGFFMSSEDQVYIGDFNGDHLQDLFRIARGISTGLEGDTRVFLSWNLTCSVTIDGNLDHWNYHYHYTSKTGDRNIVIGDFNGDGAMDILLQGKDDTQKTSLRASTKIPSQMITKIHNPIGGSIEIAYSLSSTIKDAIQSEKIDDQNHPVYIPNKTVRNLVTKITLDDGNGKKFNTNYSYSNGMFYTGEKTIPREEYVVHYPTGSQLKTVYYYFGDNKRRTDLLYETITQTDEQTGEKFITYYNQRDYRFAGLPIKQEVYAGNGSLMSRVNYAYYGEEREPSDLSQISTIFDYIDKDGISQKTRFIKVKSITTTTYEMGQELATTVQTFEYNDFGAVTLSTDSATGLEQIDTSATYIQDTSTWILNRVRKVQSINHSTGALVSTIRWNYKNDRLDSKEEYLDTESRWIKTSYTFDDCGNLATITDPLGNTTTIHYDDEYRTYPHTVEDSLGHVTTYDYDPRYGNLKTVTDQNGNTTSYTYDEFGRLSEVIAPNGKWQQQVLYHDELTGNPSTQYTEVRTKNESAIGYTYEKTYFDGLGRVYRKASKATDQLELYQDTIYNANGYVGKVSNPYLGGCDQVFYTKYAYDPAGRLIQTTLPNGTIGSRVVYSGSNGRATIEAINANNQSFITEYDARGRVVRLNEPEGGVVSYTYDAANRLTTAVNAAGKVTTVTYDSFGRRRTIQDPDAGIWAYTYDDLGRMKTESDPRGEVINYDYEHSYLVRKYSDDGTIDVNYSYDNSALRNTKGRLSSVTDGRSVSTFSYNKKGNISTMLVSIDGIDFSFAMSYNAEGKLAGLTYPDGKQVQYHYADLGYIDTVTMDNARLVSYGRMGQVESTVTCGFSSLFRMTGNNILTVFGYDPASLQLKSIKTKKVHEGDFATGSLDADVQIRFSMGNAPLAPRASTGASGTTPIVLENVLYKTDAVGNILGIEDKLNATYSQTFTYDALNRLKTASGIYGQEGYGYNRVGNLRTKKNRVLTYGDPEHPSAVTSDNLGNTYAYDASGNMITSNALVYTYDALNRLVTTSDGNKYTYDFSGVRVKKENAAGKITYNIGGLYEVVKEPDAPALHSKYIYGISGELVSRIDSTGQNATQAGLFNNRMRMYDWHDPRGLALGIYNALSYSSMNPIHYREGAAVLLLAGALFFLYFWGRRQITGSMKGYSHYGHLPRWAFYANPVILVSFFGVFGISGCFTDVNQLFQNLEIKGIYFFHPDHLGSVRMVSDKDGTVVARYAYTPYGERLEAFSSGIQESRRGYNAKELDEDTNLLYYGSRYYNPEIGRFTQPDSIIDRAFSTQGWNRYMYVHGNPVSRTDPAGNSFWSSVWGVIKVVLGGGGSVGGSRSGSSGITTMGAGGGNNFPGSTWYDPISAREELKQRGPLGRPHGGNNGGNDGVTTITQRTPAITVSNGSDMGADYQQRPLGYMNNKPLYFDDVYMPGGSGQDYGIWAEMQRSSSTHYMDPKVGPYGSLYGNGSAYKTAIGTLVSWPFEKDLRMIKNVGRGTPLFISMGVSTAYNTMMYAAGHGDPVTWAGDTIQDGLLGALSIKVGSIFYGAILFIGIPAFWAIIGGIAAGVGLGMFGDYFITPFRQRYIDSLIRSRFDTNQ